MFRRMCLIRRFEDAVGAMHLRGEIVGAVHTSQGQEGEIVGACMALRDDDYMIGNHRSHGHPIGKGAALRGLMAELLGKKTGVCGGKGGSMHLADFSVGSLGETSIVGSGVPVAAGAAFGAKMQGLGRVTLCFFGDGATSQGAWHEGMNFAAIWDLPVVFLCENNLYGVTTPINTVSRVANIADRAVAYGMPGVIVDGQDVIAVYEVVGEAVRRARAGEGPTLVEAKTYRYMEHGSNMGRAFDYRPEGEMEHWLARDPLKLLRQKLLDEMGFTDEALAAIELAAQEEVADAIEFGRASAYPEAASAYTDVVSAMR